MSLASARRAIEREYAGEWYDNPNTPKCPLGGQTFIGSVRDPEYRRAVERYIRGWKRRSNKVSKNTSTEDCLGLMSIEERLELSFQTLPLLAKEIRDIRQDEESEDTVPPTEGNIRALLEELPDYRDFVAEVAQDRAREEEAEEAEAVKNLPAGLGGGAGSGTSIPASERLSPNSAAPTSVVPASGSTSPTKTETLPQTANTARES